MRVLLRWLVVAAVGLVLCVGIGEAEGKKGVAKRPRVTALVGFPFHDKFPACVTEESADMLMAVGAYSSRQGWMGSDDTGGLMHNGDLLPLYGLVSGRIGSVRITEAAGPVAKAERFSFPRGMGSGAKVQFAQGVRDTQRHDWQVALWHAPGTPAPRWVPAREIEPVGRIHRDLVSRWLRSRGVSKEAIRAVRISQILSADLNRDGRRETLLALNWYDPDGPSYVDVGPYLLMRHLPPGARRERTALIARDLHGSFSVTGLCDLDGDGWAEVIVSYSDGERWGTRLYYHAPQGYRFVEGDLNGY